MRNYRFSLLLAIGAACLGSVHNSQLLAADSPSIQSQKALQEQTSARYAQQAVQNPQADLDRENQLWLLLVLAIVAAFGWGTALFLFLRLRRRPAIPNSLTQEEALLEATESDVPPETSEVNNHQEAAVNDTNSLVEINAQQEAAEASSDLPSIVCLPNLDHIETLMQDLQDIDPKKRQKAIWELAQKSDSRAMKPLVDLMIDTDSQERSLILESLSQISTRTLKPMNQALAISLQDKNPQVRKNAIRDLTRIYDVMSQISQMLCHAIDDGDHEVKETAKWALTQINLQMPPRLDLVSSARSAPAASQTPTVSVEEFSSESAEL